MNFLTKVSRIFTKSTKYLFKKQKELQENISCRYGNIGSKYSMEREINRLYNLKKFYIKSKLFSKKEINELDKYINNSLVYPIDYRSFNPPMNYKKIIDDLSKTKFIGFNASTQALRFVNEWIRSRTISKPIVSITINYPKKLILFLPNNN